MEYKEVFTQAELTKAIDSFYPICKGDGEFEISGSAQVRASGSAQVRAYESAQVRAYESAQVRAYGSAQVTAYDSAQVRAYGSAQVRAYDSAQVRAYGSAQVRASGSAQVRAYDSAQVRASKFVAVTIASDHSGQVTGGVQINIPPVKTADEWCEYYGVETKKGVAILFKAVDDDFATSRSREKNITYKPGNKPEAPDWDGGQAECGGGLHFSPSPVHALDFNHDAKHFVACPVKVSEIVVHYPASYSSKVKAPRVCQPCYEVDIQGNKL